MIRDAFIFSISDANSLNNKCFCRSLNQKLHIEPSEKYELIAKCLILTVSGEGTPVSVKVEFGKLIYF